MKKGLIAMTVCLLPLVLIFSGCFEDSIDEGTANLQLHISVLNYQCLVDGPIKISLSLKNTGDENKEVEGIIIPGTLQFYITTPEGYSIYCTNKSQTAIFHEEMLPGSSIYETYSLQDMTFGNEMATFNFSIEGIYSIKAVYKGSLESNTRHFRIRKATTLSMSAQQFIDDAEINLTDKKLTIDYKSLDYGDAIILHDNISDIVYLGDEDVTRIKFTVEEFELLNHTATNLTFDFVGNITDEYKKEDEVNITFHIEWDHWFMGPQQDMYEYSVETASESELDDVRINFTEYISANFPGYLLPQSCISHT